MHLQEHVTAYYDALRDGEPLVSFFGDRDALVKFGINEQLRGADEVERGLRQQTDRTTDWTVTSHQLETDRHGDVGWFSDLVTMAWTDTERDETYDLETRWSGTAISTDGGWQFVGMHVSVPYAFAAEEDEVEEDLIDS